MLYGFHAARPPAMLHGFHAAMASAALLMAGLGTCQDLRTHPREAPPDAEVRSTRDELPPVRLYGPPTDAPAEVERDADFCDTEHPTQPVPDRRLYATWRQFPLHRAEHGLDGTLRVLQDSRFTGPGAVRRGTHPMLPPCDALLGRLEVLDAGGHPVHAWDTSPQADVTAHSLGPQQTLYVVRDLVQCLASCWCGDRVSFLRVVDGRIATLETRRGAGEVRPVSVVTQGCYESSGLVRDARGRLEIQIHRMPLLGSTGLAVDERHGWDGDAWWGSVVERKIAW